MAIKSKRKSLLASDEEINAWRLQYPSIALTRRFAGDRDLAGQYRGEADKLLYQLKNQMQFQQLGQLKMTRLFVDGTVIIAWSIFGQDFIDTDVRKTIVEVAPDVSIIFPPPKCSITLFNLPDVVQPMRYPGEIRFKEVEGIDYIKTYYEVDFSECSECILKWNMLGGTCEGTSPFETYKLCNPFIFHDDSVPLWWDSQKELYPVNPRPDDHCIHTLWGNCGAEIIAFGKDGDDKTWFKWKAYTEYGYTYSFMTQYTRTGYGIMELLAFAGNRLIRGVGPTEEVYFEEGSPLCHDLSRIAVDCCHKNSDIRNVNLWWESISNQEACGPSCGGQPFMFYGSMKICEVPDAVSTSLYYMLCTPRCTRTFYTIPDIKGGCIPFTWGLDGYAGLTLMPSKSFGKSAWLSYKCEMDPPHCQASADIFVKDRCGSEDTVHFMSCCERIVASEYPPLAISYTSLVMGCNTQQTFGAYWGCEPYTWSLSGGGSLNKTVGQEVIYTSPATNPNCVENPTITLRDCCGQSAQIRLAINCYTGALYALTQFQKLVCSTCTYGATGLWEAYATFCNWQYDCNGSLAETCFYNGSIKSECKCYEAGTKFGCNPSQYPQCCPGDICGGCQSSSCSGGLSLDYCRACGLYDRRSDAQKEQGCCPINPLTGLPF